MGSIKIITDNAAQFSKPGCFDNLEISLINHHINLANDGHDDLQKMKIVNLPAWVTKNGPPSFLPPNTGEISELITSAYHSCNDLFIITVSRFLHPGFNEIETICAGLRGKTNIHLIDSESIGIGEGQIVQLAAEMVKKQLPATAIDEALRKTVPHVYMLLCTPNFSYLNKSGFIDAGQSVVGEMLSMLPIFSLEDGKLNPVEKVKNVHSLIDFFIEFIDEFDDLQSVAFLQPAPPACIESNLVRQKIEEAFPKATYSEHMVNPFMAALFGPRCMGIVVTEKTQLSY
ncbi:MAG TPA: DegV family protein [Anaerolineaceae bacterium]|nr:DegV family protein [Anaerolineaceae bacterium]